VDAKLRNLLKDNGTCTSLADIINNGTSQLDLEKLPPALLSAVKQQRKDLGLGDLTADATAEGQRNDTSAPEAANNVSEVSRPLQYQC
jgi:hypothetical protein